MADGYENDPCKEKIQALVDSYNNHHSGNLFDATLVKGIRKRLFGLRTQGIKELERFLKSPSMINVDPKAKITGENLKTLCAILSARDDRIYGTRRSYERYVDKKTNQVYQHIYQMLWLNMEDINAKESERNISQSDEDVIKKVILKRENYKIRAELEKNPDALTTVNKNDDKGHSISNACKLGLALVCGTAIQHIPDENENHIIQNIPKIPGDFSKVVKCSDNGNTIYGVIRTFLDNIFLSTIPKTNKFDKDIKGGLKWLEYASKKGEQVASYELARIYAGASSYISQKEVNVNEDKAIKYLKLAGDQGNQGALELLTNGGKWGAITILPQKQKKSLRI